ncbi:MAG: CDP-alcohol phosphatidyltransferase family protein [Spirochaetes bacterium]|nr:CDP-alcohol phosphatidyltransferase family protein [Spirochaetota bacterium]
MIPEIALIKSEKEKYNCEKKICGLYPLERNIIILIKAGVKKIFLDLSDDEKIFYNSKIIRHIKNVYNAEIITDVKPLIDMPYLLMPSNLFLQAHYFDELPKYFRQRGKLFSPIIRHDQFLLLKDDAYNKAVKLARDYIIENTGGFIAQKINKRLSIPISLQLVKTRIHPNYLTVINMIIGIMSSVFLLFDSYWYTVLGGFLFQTASIMDGVDGEVAKFTFKVSKIGGWLDTLSDNLTLVLFLSVLSYLYFINTPGILSLIVVLAVFTGIIFIIGAMLIYLRRYSKSGSLVAYDREFLQKLPYNDPFVFITHKLKYFTKKEFFSILFFLICLTGRAYFFVPVIAIVLFIAAIILVIIDIRYLGTFGEKYLKKDFTSQH